MTRSVLESPLRVVSAGAALLAQTLATQGLAVEEVDWRPPAEGSLELAVTLGQLWDPRIDAANEVALRRVLDARQVLLDVRPAGEVIPGMQREMVLHAGPPIDWARLSPTVRAAAVGAIMHEGLAPDADLAEQMAARGDVRFEPCHHHQTVGPMAGMTTYSMPVLVVENRAAGNRAYAILNEGLGRVLRYGGLGPDVLERLDWMRRVLGPAMGEALRGMPEGIDLRALIAQAVHMGDECHNRNRAASALLIKDLAPRIAALDSLDATERRRVLEFAAGNEHFFLNVGMAACKAAMDAAHGVPRSSLVTVMARNGTDFGIRVSGLGDRWFTGPAQTPRGLYFAGHSADDASPDMGDSAITETAGLGGFAMAAAPAIVQFVGGSPQDAILHSQRMYEITAGESEAYTLPILNFRGTPTGVDIRMVVQTGIVPQINTGIASKRAGVGQIGAGLVNPPYECFAGAVMAFDGAQ
ncbi:MAG: DUF1116 domain-containing protein [Chloroflexi bacterium]|nr:DUF1116 domain-containing protein [Chloroflexota bacterium]